MLCNICKQNEATVHLTTIVDNQMQKVDLCDACSKSKGVGDPTSFALADMLLGLGAAKEMEEAAAGVALKCPNCGFTQADFKKAGRFGCSECYAAFAGALEGLLKSMHKGTRHVGKTPRPRQLSRDYASRLKTLQKQLEKAIAGEKFEEAAALRDQINEARSRLKLEC